MTTLHWLNVIVQQLLDRHAPTVSIMSGQMGMIMYHLAGSHFGHLEVIDKMGLADRTFTSCQETSGLPRNSLGLGMSYQFLFEKWNTIKTCLPLRPDIIFDLYRDYDISSVSHNGYDIVYTQYGQTSPPSILFPIYQYAIEYFIAVRDDLIPAIHWTGPAVLDFRSLQQ